MAEAKKQFSYPEALATFPLVRRLTDAAVRQIEALVNNLHSRAEMEARRHEIDQACQLIIDAWTEAVAALGCEVKGLWRVDWDSGSGYYCWHYPEEALGHFYGYHGDRDQRMPVN